jgi:hypothetical protein
MTQRHFLCPDCESGRVEYDYGITDYTWGHDIGTASVTCDSCGGSGELSFDDGEYEDAMTRGVEIAWDDLIAWIMVGNGNDFIGAQDLATDYGYTRPAASAA